MTHKFLFFTLATLLLGALAGPLVSGASSGMRFDENVHLTSPVQEPEHAEEDETPLQQNMSVINKGMRKLRRGLRKAEDLPAALPVIVDMQAAAQFCKTETPPLADALEGDDKAAFLKGYRIKMIELQQQMLELESAVIAGDMEKAQTVYQAMKVTEDEGHEKYTEDED